MTRKLTDEEKELLEIYVNMSDDELLDLTDEDLYTIDSLESIGGGVLASMAAPSIKGTPEYKQARLADARREFKQIWSQMALVDKARDLYTAMGEGDGSKATATELRPLMQQIAGSPYESEQAMMRIYTGERDPSNPLSYPERFITRTKDILTAIPRGAVGAVSEFLGDGDGLSAMAEREAEGTESLAGAIGMGIFRDPYMVPSMLIGAPLQKGIASGLTKATIAPREVLAQAALQGVVSPKTANRLGRVVQGVEKMYPMHRGFATGAAEGAAMGGLQLGESAITDSGYDLSNAMLETIVGGGAGGLMGLGSQTVGGLLSGSGMKALEGRMKARHMGSLTPRKEMPDAVGKFARKKLSALQDWDAEVQDALENGIMTRRNGALYYSDGSPVIPPSSTYSLQPASVDYGVSQVEKIRKPQKMAKELETQIKDISESRKGILTDAPPITEEQRNDMFRAVTDRLDELKGTGELTPSEHTAALNQLQRMENDYDLNRMQYGFSDVDKGLNPLLQTRQRMDRKYKGNVWVDDQGKIQSKTDDFDPGQLTRKLFRDELNDVIGSLSAESRALDLEQLSPRIKVKEAFADPKKTEQSFDPRKLASGLAGIDPSGVNRLWLGQKLSPRIMAGTDEAIMLGNPSGISLKDITQKKTLTPRGKARQAVSEPSLISPLPAGVKARTLLGTTAPKRAAINETQRRWEEYIEEQRLKRKLSGGI